MKGRGRGRKRERKRNLVASSDLVEYLIEKLMNVFLLVSFNLVHFF